MFKGSIVAVITPFLEDLSVNYKKLEELLNWHVEQGTNGIVILGTTGENPTLDDNERISVIDFTVKVIAGRIPVIAGTGSNNTYQTINFSKKVEKLGVDGLLVVTPYYNKSNYLGYINHFTLVADSVNTPIIIYNVPGRTACSIPPKAVAVLSKHKNIVGIKEASSDLSYAIQVRKECGEDFLLFSGNDDIVIPVLSLGGAGVISVAANVIPKEFSQMVKLYLEGNHKEALDIQLKYLDLISSLFIEVNPIPLKEMMNQLGHDVGEFRFPLYPISDEGKNIITNIVKRYFK